MAINIIRNPVSTPEQMAKFLGVSAERLAAVRKIMNEDDEPAAKSPASRSKRAPHKDTVKKTKKRA